MCHFELSLESIEIAHLIDFKKLHFADELADLKEFQAAGLTVDEVDQRACRPHAGARHLDGLRQVPARRPAAYALLGDLSGREKEEEGRVNRRFLIFLFASSRMPDSGFLALFLVGLLGGTHCVGMCGGIVGALSMGGAPRLSPIWPTTPDASHPTPLPVALSGTGWRFTGAGRATAAAHRPHLLANLMLIALGLYLMGLTRALAFSERLGQNLWRRIQPSTRRFCQRILITQAFPLGLLGGWLPCGLVYSALATALTAGLPAGGVADAGLRLGTLPNLLLAGFLLARLRHWVQQPAVRVVAGLLVAAFGVWGLVGVWRMAGQ